MTIEVSNDGVVHVGGVEVGRVERVGREVRLTFTSDTENESIILHRVMTESLRVGCVHLHLDEDVILHRRERRH